MSQLWAAVAAAHFGVDRLEAFSGGTESTAFNPRAGFDISRPAAAENPRYLVSFTTGVAPQECFSKVYTDEPNPQAGFCAVLTCSAADQACPVVHGADLRLALPFEDPKVADGTEGEAAKYDEGYAQIARELLFALAQVK